MLTKQQLLFPLAEDEVFDEMNLVEIPFALPQMKASKRTRADLTPDGSCYLATASESLPTALAQRVVLALLWLTKEQNGFTSPEVEFTLRRLTQSFMYPNRAYRANQTTLTSVRNEIYRVMATRLHHDRWYNRELGRHTKVAAAIFDNVQETVPSAGLSSPFRLRWGHFVYESVRSSYTKPLDLRTWLQITNPIDQTLYRWLDRQLATKDVQVVRSCQNFARYKLLLHAKRIAAGGRTASSYVVGKLQESLERLNGVGVPVRMTVDDRTPDFTLQFERIAGETNEVVHGRTRPVVNPESPVDRIVRAFREHFHGLPAGAKCTLAPRDRTYACTLYETYGEERAIDLIEVAARLHRQSANATETINFLVGVDRYLNPAEAELAKAVVEDESRDGEDLWTAYCTALLEVPLTDEEAAEVSVEAETAAAPDLEAAGRLLSDSLRDRILSKHRREIALRRRFATTKDAFLTAHQEGRLDALLTDIHGSNPLEALCS